MTRLRCSQLSEARRGTALEVRFRTKQLQECAFNADLAVKAFGRASGRKYVERIASPRDAESTREIPSGWRFHPLRGSLTGLYSLDVNQRKGVRLLVSIPEPNLIVIEKLDGSHYG